MSQKKVRQVVGKDWASVKGDWTPGRGATVVLQWAGEQERESKVKYSFDKRMLFNAVRNTSLKGWYDL